MKSIKAIFIKQSIDLIKNRSILIQFAVFPVIAFIMTELVAKADESIPDNMFTIMFATMFAGMVILTTAANIIAEDKELKSLRFLIMAGVKPHEYLFGIGGALIFSSLLISIVFAFMGNFTGREFIIFISVILLSSTASMILGASIGILSKNQQSAVATGMPIAMVLAFCPLVTMFNKTAEKIFFIFYTQQMSIVMNNLSTGIIHPLLIILANIAVYTVFFSIVYKKKGLKSL